MAVVTTHEHLGDVPATPGDWTGVHRVLQQTLLILRVGLLTQRLRIADDAGNQTNDCLGHGERSHLSPIEDVVTQTELMNAPVLAGIVDDTMVDALVASTAEDDAIGMGQLRGVILTKRRARGGGDDDVHAGVWVSSEQVVECLPPRIGFHDHARPTATGGVVHRAVPVMGPGAQIVGMDVDNPVVDGLAEQGDAQHVEELRKDRQVVQSHRASSA